MPDEALGYARIEDGASPRGKDRPLNDYGALKALVKEAGLLEVQGRYYAVKLAYTLGMLAIGVAAMVFTGWELRLALLAPFLAFASAQLAFLAHDLGHKQVFSSTRLNTWAGMVLANLLVGMSLGWWNDKHNAHHANPNHEDLDPDIDIPFMAFSEEQALRKTGLSRIVTLLMTTRSAGTVARYARVAASGSSGTPGHRLVADRHSVPGVPLLPCSHLHHIQYAGRLGCVRDSGAS